MTKIEKLKAKVDGGVSLTEQERTWLQEGIFNNYLKDDDPKYNDANWEWLESMTDQTLVDKYEEYA